MDARNGKYCVIDLNDNWTGTSVDDSKVAIATDTEAIWGEIAAHLPEFNDKVANFAAPAIDLPLTKALVTSPSKAPEPYHWSPTLQEVDAYVNSLESEVSQEGLRMQQRQAFAWRTGINRSPALELFWFVLVRCGGGVSLRLVAVTTIQLTPGHRLQTNKATNTKTIA